MEDLGHFKVEPHVEGYHYKAGTMVFKKDGIYETLKYGLKKRYSIDGPAERMVYINNETYFELESEKPSSDEKGKKTLNEILEGRSEEENKELSDFINGENIDANGIPLNEETVRTEMPDLSEDLGVISIDGNLHEIESIEEIGKTETPKPPLGIKPKYIHDQERSNSLVEAIQRYLSAGKQIPLEWVEEFNEFFKQGDNPVEEDDFDIDKVYEQKDFCKWRGNVWRFVGMPWAVNSDSLGYHTYFHTQKKTIGMYPSEKFGWRKI